MRSFLEVLLSCIFTYDLCFILNTAQPFTHWTQRLIGWDCFTWAKIFQRLSCTILLFFGALEILALHSYFFGAINIILAIRFTLFYTKVIRIARDSVTKTDGALNLNINVPLRAQFRLIWIIAATLSVLFDLASLFTKNIAPTMESFAMFTLPIILLYLVEVCLACTPLPPKKSKLRTWAEGIWKSLKDSISPEELSPVPA